MTKAIFHLRQFHLLLLVLLCALFTLPLSAREAYVEKSKDETTLTFYYDNNRSSRNGKTWGIDEKKTKDRNYNETVPAWAGFYISSDNDVVTKVVFDVSFKNFRPTTTKRWFFYLHLISIEGIENLNTSEVTDMSEMFYGCFRLTELNVSNFNTSAVTDMSDMFFGCSGLTELNLSNFNTSAVTNMSGMFWGCRGVTSLNLSNFNTSAVKDMSRMFANCSGLKAIFNTNTWQCEQSHDMFEGCTQLRGAVPYNPSMVDAKMANLTTGYFTDPSPKAYVLQSEYQQTLTFFYDANRTSRSGKTWDIDEKSSSSEPVWAGTYEHPNGVVTKVVFDASFKNFRPTTTKYWFYNLEALTTIKGLENLNTSAVTDMRWMFYNCSGLEELNVSNFNTSKVTGMREMFYGCSGLKELNLSNFNTSKVTDMSYMFSWCTSLTSLNLSNFNTSAVTDMGWMFRNCSGLTELNLSNFNTSAVTDMNEMFRGCSGLTSLNVSNFNTSAVWNMNKMFEGCSSLKTIFNTQTWRYNLSENMFYGCAQLNGAVKYDESKVDVTMANPITGYFTNPNKKVEAYVLQSEDQHTLTFYYDNNRKLRSGKTWDIDEKSSDSKPVWAGTDYSPNKVVTKVEFDTSFKNFRPTTTNSWFFNLEALTTIEGLENLNTSSVRDMRGMFYRCSGLKELNISTFNTSAVTDMSFMFSGCSSLTSLNLSNFNTSAVTDMGWMFKNCSGLTELNLSNFNTSAVTDMNEMFRGCSSLRTILNPNTWRCEKDYLMFSGCTQLKGTVKYDASKLDVTMANPTTGYFTDPDRKAYVLLSEDEQTLTFFYDVNRTLRSGKTWGIDEKSRRSEPVWAGNKAVTKVVFDASFKKFTPTTTKDWFSYVSALTTIEGLENLNTSEVTNMSGMFSGCSRLTSLNLSNFNTSAVTDMSYMFYGCSSLTSLNLSSFNTSAVTDMSYMFYGYRGVTSLNLSNFNTSAVTNMRGMFSNSGLTALNLSNFNTSAVKDMSDMFRECSGLRTLNVSNFNTSAVTNMSAMFRECSSLKKLKISNFNTSAVTNMSAMFYRCSGLTELNLSNFNTSAVEYMDEMFRSCSGLTELNLSNFNTSSVPITRRMFYDCSSLKTIFNTNTWRCGDSQDMFSGCRELKGAVEYSYSKVNDWMANPATGYFTDLNARAYVCQSEGPQTLTFYYDNNRKSRSGKTWDIDEKSSSSKPAWAGTDISPDNVVTKVKFDASFKDFRPTTTNYWFYNLKALITIEGLENLNTSAVTDMGDMFSGCYRLISLNLSNFNTAAVTDMRWMFSGCSGLKELNLSSFNTSAVTDMNGMFFGCSSLKTIFNPNTWRCEESQDMFDGCTQLKGAVKYDDKKLDATMANPTTGYFTDPNRKEAYVQQSEDQHTLTFYYDSYRKLRSGKIWRIDENSNSSEPAWAGTYSSPNNIVTKVKFDASFKYFRPSTTYSWFSYLTALTTIEGLENLNTSAVTNMNAMFVGCSGLMQLNVSNFNTSTVTNMSVMFADCSSLKELNLSNFNTSAVTEMNAMFLGCSGLKELNVSNFNTSAVTDMSGMFAGCSGLKELNVSNFNTSKVTNMGWMFEGCSSLKELNVSNFNTAGVIDMRWMFENCSGLKTIINTQTWRCEQSQDMFKGCTQLKGAVKYDESKVDATMANPTTGYFSQKLPSAIGRVVFDDNNATQIYNLQGKRVNANQRHLPAGFYIVNGKKVYLNEKP